MALAMTSLGCPCCIAVEDAILVIDPMRGCVGATCPWTYIVFYVYIITFRLADCVKRGDAWGSVWDACGEFGLYLS
jgi:hypothetical protein